MNIFNSLGSNYNGGFVFRSLTRTESRGKQKLKNFLEEKYKGKAVLTYKGRQALELALSSMGLKNDSGVAVTGFTCIAVIDAIEKQNLKPVYLDIDHLTLNFAAETLEEKLKSNKNIRVVIIQNTLGYPCDLEEILRVCKRYKLTLIEDLAHSVGTTYSNGQEAGTVGDFAVFSFSQDKVIDAVSGGALVIRNLKFWTSDKRQMARQGFSKDKLYPLLTWLIRKTYSIGVGKVLHFVFRILSLLSDPMKSSNNSAMSDWHARLALKEFDNLKQQSNHRRTIAKIYADHLSPKILSQEIVKQIPNSSNLRFPIFADNRGTLVHKLKESGIYVSDIWYDAPVAPKKYLGLARYSKSSCPNAEKVSDKIMNLPTHINVSEKDALEISRIINGFLNT